MNIQLVNPRKSLNKAFLKQKPLRSEIELFKTILIRLLDKVDEIERESLKQAASFALVLFS
jgi:adenine-specific DNA-methyltransferase